MHFIKFYLPFYMIIYLFIAFVLPSYRTYKVTGINPMVFGNSSNAHDYIGRLMKLMVVLLFVMILISALAQNWYIYLLPAAYLETTLF